MPEWVDKVTGFIDNFTKFIDNGDNKQLIGYLQGTGGFLALGAGIAEMISDYKESQKTEYEKSVSDLFAFLFKFTSDQIRTIIYRSQNLDEKDLSYKNKNELKQFFSGYKKSLINDIYKLESPWLPMHPLIQKFKNKTIEYLESIDFDNQNIKILKEFERSFEYKIAYRLYDESNSNLELFRKIAKEDLVQDTITAYLDFLMRDYHKFNQLYETDQSPILNLPTVYVHDRKAIRLNIKKSWTRTDSDLYNKHSNEIKNIEEILDNFLQQSKNNSFEKYKRLIIGAPYGVGKTTLVRKLVYDCAIKRGRSAKEYIPIIIYLKNGYHFQRGTSREPIENLLKDIFIDFVSDRNEDTPVLLILDALDEYSDSSPTIDELFQNIPFFQKFSNKKIIYTTRLNEEFETLSQFEDEYIRLLPFNENQVDNFLQQKRSDLTYNLLKNYHLDDEVIKKPLILSILVESFPKLEQDFKRLKEKKILTSDLTKTLAYTQIFYDHYYGKYRIFSESEYKDKIRISFQEEKKILRLIAYYKQIKKDLNLQELDIWSNQTDIEIENLKPILNTYLILTKNDNDTNKKSNIRINFLHQTYEEFLLAEYLVEQYIKGNTDCLNIGKPSDATISFFKGFLDLLKSDNITIDKFVTSEYDKSRKTLLYSLDYKTQLQQNSLSEIKDNMESTAKESFNNESVSILKIEDEIKSESNLPKKLKWYSNSQSEINNYENLWIRRWISLIVLGYLDSEYISALEKSKIENLSKRSSNNVPKYVKFLSNANLSYADLSYTNLSYVNLSHAKLWNANLSYANLSRIDLTKAELYDAYLSRCDLYYADLSDSALSSIDFSYANLARANLSGANLSRANLSYANLSSVNLYNTNLSNSILINNQAYTDLAVNHSTD